MATFQQDSSLFYVIKLGLAEAQVSDNLVRINPHHCNNLSDLTSDPQNARKRTDRSTELIKESLGRYGAARSIVIDEENRVLAGNGTIEGAKAAGIKSVRVIETDGNEIIAVKRIGLSEEDKVGLALADNRTSDLSEWDQEMLHRLSEEHDLSPWFEQEDLDELFNVTEVDPVEGNTDPDDVPETPEDPTTKPGDLWILGNHRLLCGDSHRPLMATPEVRPSGMEHYQHHVLDSLVRHGQQPAAVPIHCDLDVGLKTLELLESALNDCR